MRVLPLLLAALLGFAAPLQAEEPDGAAILHSVHLRDRGKDFTWDLKIDLTDRNGDERHRTGKIFRREFSKKRSEQITVFLSPPNMRHTALLEIEVEDGDDFMWLYLPALKTAKRIPPIGRGDKFVETDFTMEDINLGFQDEDYNGTVQERIVEDGHPVAIVRLDPKTPELQRNLGFEYALFKIWTNEAYIVEERFFKGDREIRRNEAHNVHTVDGIWTPGELRSHDLVNDHRTVLTIVSATYNKGVPESYFSEKAMAREMYH